MVYMNKRQQLQGLKYRQEQGEQLMDRETILVVDDSREIVYSISELLKYEGYQVVKAYDGMEALDALEREKIDLILLDVMMPKMNDCRR